MDKAKTNVQFFQWLALPSLTHLVLPDLASSGEHPQRNASALGKTIASQHNLIDLMRRSFFKLEALEFTGCFPNPILLTFLTEMPSLTRISMVESALESLTSFVRSMVHGYAFPQLSLIECRFSTRWGLEYTFLVLAKSLADSVFNYPTFEYHPTLAISLTCSAHFDDSARKLQQ